MTEIANIVLVDEQDNTIGVETKTAAHRQGLLHRAFSVFIIDQAQRVLLQQRHPDKYHCGGLWTNTCCSHPFPDENIIIAGQRRLQQELGFTTPLIHIGQFCYRAEFSNGLIEHEYDHVLLGQYDHQPLNQFNQTEVSALKWMPLTALQQELNQSPQQYTPWLAPALDHVNKHLLQTGLKRNNARPT